MVQPCVSPATSSTPPHPLTWWKTPSPCGQVEIHHVAPAGYTNQTPYQLEILCFPRLDGPFLVLKRTPKHYTIKVNGQQQTVSIDRLKHAFLEDLAPPQLPPTPPTPPVSTPTWTTRSGRTVCCPDRLTL